MIAMGIPHNMRKGQLVTMCKTLGKLYPFYSLQKLTERGIILTQFSSDDYCIEDKKVFVKENSKLELWITMKYPSNLTFI